jgi:hypothetical protein
MFLVNRLYLGWCIYNDFFMICFLSEHKMILRLNLLLFFIFLIKFYLKSNFIF